LHERPAFQAGLFVIHRAYLESHGSAVARRAPALPNPAPCRRAGRRCPELRTAAGTVIRCRALGNFVCIPQYVGARAAHATGPELIQDCNNILLDRRQRAPAKPWFTGKCSE
jgi:hypothetical protein